MTCSAKSSTRGCRRRGGRRCTSLWRNCWSMMRTCGARRRRSPTTARWRCRWETAAAPSPRSSRRAGRRPPGWPLTRPPAIFAAPSRSPAASRPPTWRRYANTVTRCAGPANGEDARSAFLIGRKARPRDWRHRGAGTGRVRPHRVATMTESSRPDVIALLEEALAALDGEAAGRRDMRWLLTASLARELADGPDRDLPRAVALGSRRGGRRPGRRCPDRRRPPRAGVRAVRAVPTCAGSQAPRPNG